MKSKLLIAFGLVAVPAVLCAFSYGYKNNPQTGKPDMVVTGATTSDIIGLDTAFVHQTHFDIYSAARAAEHAALGTAAYQPTSAFDPAGAAAAVKDTTTKSGVLYGDGSAISAATSAQMQTAIGAGVYQAAGSYAPATSGTSILKGDGSGGFSAASAGTDYWADLPVMASVYQWNNWAPSDVAGTMTNAPSTAAASVAASGYVTFSNSGGTLTTTFTRAGKYLVSVGSSLASSATFTYARMFLNLGGTATRYIYRSPTIGSGDAVYSWDLSLSSTFLVSATANQTLTVLPTLELGKVGGSTGNYNASAQMSAVYVGQ